MIIGNQQSHGTAGIQAGGNDRAEQKKHQVLIRPNAVPHILQCVFLVFLRINIGKGRVMLLDALAHGEHHKEENHGGNQSNIPDADPHIFTDGDGPQHSGANGRQRIENRLGL